MVVYPYDTGQWRFSDPRVLVEDVDAADGVVVIVASGCRNPGATRLWEYHKKLVLHTN